MKIRLDVSRERYDELSEQLRGLGVEIDEDAALVLSEDGRYADSLLLRERHWAYDAQLSPDCRAACSACGAQGLLPKGVKCDG